MKPTSLPLLLPLLAVAIACDAFAGASCPESTATSVRQARKTAGFTGVHARGSMEVVLLPGDVASVEVEAPADLIDRIDTDVIDGVLEISAEGCVRSRSPIRIQVVAPRLAAIRLSGSGDVVAGSAIRGEALAIDLSGSGSVRLASATVERLRVAIAGSGSVDLKGRAARLEASIAGSGDLDAAGLDAGRVDASLSGSGDAEVRVREGLAASISGSGDLVYHGRPTRVTRSVVGSGSIRPAR